MIERRSEFDRAEVLPDGSVQLRTRTLFYENGKPCSEPTYHREVLTPGADYSKAPDIVRDICRAVHTTTRIEAFQSSMKTLLEDPSHGR